MNFKQRRGDRKRQFGAQYEAYVANQLRQQGWNVTETGLSGRNDHGIDLIATKEGTTRYIQCKGWKRHKYIHEDVVSQLLGSVAAIEGLDNLQGVEKYIYSSARLDDYAAKEAERLDIGFVRMTYPRLPFRR